MEYGYAWEKLYSAVLGLATAHSLEVRLHGAGMDLTMLKPDDLPPTLRQRFAMLMHRMTATGARGDEGTLAATAAAMTPEQRTATAEEIVNIYDAVTRFMPRDE